MTLPPHRVLVLGGGLPAFFNASGEEKRDAWNGAHSALMSVVGGVLVPDRGEGEGEETGDPPRVDQVHLAVRSLGGRAR